ncbi:hypothetical protein B7R21_05145 [Subtercola boreus]|uniref:Uncharacterized protein n=1 Tax=Subtercola boreus TaxID=120213 RepID=A0A3E0VZD5_9MICO|nr:hypothetical protein [Subtercola boreus]RFA15402.1 hypothetical protein B7R21_05145 [Subtercola boreus]
MAETASDPFHDFSVPQDADLVASPTPNAESSGDDDGDNAAGSGARELDDDPLGSSGRADRGETPADD